MRIPGQRNRAPALQGEAMTPMIDVVFLLLVFFVCASVGQLPDLLLPAELGAGAIQPDAALPVPDTAIPDHQVVRIALCPGEIPGRISMQLNAQEVPEPNELRRRLIQLSGIAPLTQIILDVDDQVSNQHWISIYDLCQSLEFESISFGVRR